MGIIRLSAFTIGAVAVALSVYGRDSGLPSDRIGQDPVQIVPSVVTTQIAPVAVPAKPDAVDLAVAQALAAEAEDKLSEAQIIQASVTTSAPVSVDVTPAIELAITPEAEPTPAAAAASLFPVMFVSGSRVNLRAGPSTRQGVVAALVRGTAVDDMGPAGDGWSQIRVVETGQRGFMASRFLSANRP